MLKKNDLDKYKILEGNNQPQVLLGIFEALTSKQKKCSAPSENLTFKLARNDIPFTICME